MAITIQEIQQIKYQAEQKKNTVERCRGNLEQLMKQLKDEFDCETIEDAKKLLQELKDNGTTLSQKIEKMKNRVVALWNESQETENGI